MNAWNQAVTLLRVRKSRTNERAWHLGVAPAVKHWNEVGYTLEIRPVTPEAAGSSPVDPANIPPVCSTLALPTIFSDARVAHCAGGCATRRSFSHALRAK